MAYCTNCGSKIIPGSKFCSKCGNEILITSNKTISEKYEKESSSDAELKQSQSYLTSKIKEKPTQNISKEAKVKKYKLAKRLMIYFFLLNIPIYFLNQGNNELLGILVLSVLEVIDFLIFLIQKKKEKPFNSVLKIIFTLQILLILSYLIRNFEFIGDSVNSLVAIVILSLLLMVNIVLIAKGNKE